MKPASRLLFTAAAAVAAILLAGCETVPETGRRQLNFLSPDQELQMGITAFEQIKKEQKIADDPIKNAAIQRVGRRIAEAVGDDVEDAEWEFVLFEDDTPNAFALPGGKVGVHTGLFDVVESDDELAIVLGHEIAHVTASHGAERYSQSMLAALGGLALGTALSGEDESTRRLAMAAYGLGASVGVMLPYSRLNESEADEIGLIYAARAGYDPRAALSFWKRMKAVSEESGKPPEWLSTHPSDDTRIRRLEALMPRMLEIYEKARGEEPPA
ncbi:MAG: M48 family peptidase [Verrucomicrobia bacterium]|nr:MAG: M48 family peptidase [Verrucomicrobiota bacterium]